MRRWPDAERVARALGALGALAVAILGGCSAYAPPQPWERGTLARPEMQFDPDPLGARLSRQVYGSKEGASGGYGVGGGGCGCN